MYISTFAMCWFQQTMSSKLTKDSTFITTHSIIHDQVFVLKMCFAKIAIFSMKMSESNIFFRLTQVTNIYKHISRNKGATMTASGKLAPDKFFFFLITKRPYLKNNYITIQKGYSSKSLHWYQRISVWKKVDDESFLCDKVFMLKSHLLQKHLYLLKKCLNWKYFVVNPSPKYFNANI